MLTPVLSPSVPTSSVPHCHAQASSCSPCCPHHAPPPILPSGAALLAAELPFITRNGGLSVGSEGFPQLPVYPEVGDISTLEMLKSWMREKGSGGNGNAGSELFIGSYAELASSSLLLQEHGNKRVP